MDKMKKRFGSIVGKNPVEWGYSMSGSVPFDILDGPTIMQPPQLTEFYVVTEDGTKYTVTGRFMNLSVHVPKSVTNYENYSISTGDVK